MPCGAGYGLAVCLPLGVLVVSCENHTLSVYRLAPGFPLVHTFGSEGVEPGQFKRPFSMCFPPWGGRHSLLVAEYGGARVQEVDVMAKASVRMWCAGQVEGPWGVAASAAVVVVSECSAHFLSAFSVDTGERLWRVGGEGPAAGQLKDPTGVRLSGDGLHVLVAEYSNNRVSAFAVGDGEFVRHVVGADQGAAKPTDVVEVEGGVVVTNNVGSDAVVRLPRDGGSPAVTLATAGAGPGQCKYPRALAVLPGGALVVREEGNGGRFQVIVPK